MLRKLSDREVEVALAINQFDREARPRLVGNVSQEIRETADIAEVRQMCFRERAKIIDQMKKAVAENRLSEIPGLVSKMRKLAVETQACVELIKDSKFN